MAGFTCEPGKVLSNEEAAEMLAYDTAGVARPDAYADVVFDATGITGAVYRCRTEDEKKAAQARYDADRERSEALASRVREIRTEAAEAAQKAGGDMASEPVSIAPTGNVRTVVNDAGEPGDADTGGDADTAGTRRRSR
jgi:hypothetical protein